MTVGFEDPPPLTVVAANALAENPLRNARSMKTSTPLPRSYNLETVAAQDLGQFLGFVPAFLTTQEILV